MTHVKPASIGVVSSSRSFPYRHIPASRRRLSRAPRPVSWTGCCDSSLVTSVVCAGGIDIYGKGLVRTFMEQGALPEK